MKISVIILLAITIVGCNPPPTATIPPSPQLIRVAFPSTLEPTRESLHICANEHPEYALIFTSTSESLDYSEHDITIWYMEKPPVVNQAFPLANDDLVVIVNINNSLEDLSAEELTDIFSGRIEHWSEIGGEQKLVSVWTYPEGILMRDLFHSTLLGEAGFSLLSFIAPSPHEMLEAVIGDPGAIGFIPRSWLTSDVNTVNLDNQSAGSLTMPLLALTNENPQGAVRVLVDCLQAGAGHSALMDLYKPFE
jgi:hypothetical protein